MIFLGRVTSGARIIWPSYSEKSNRVNCRYWCTANNKHAIFEEYDLLLMCGFIIRWHWSILYYISIQVSDQAMLLVCLHIFISPLTHILHNYIPQKCIYVILMVPTDNYICHEAIYPHYLKENCCWNSQNNCSHFESSTPSSGSCHRFLWLDGKLVNYYSLALDLTWKWSP